MSAVKSIYYFRASNRNVPSISFQSAKVYLIHCAEKYLEMLELEKWHRIDHIPWDYRKEVVEILTTGSLMITNYRRKPNSTKWIYLKVQENEDFTKFKLIPGVSNLTKEQWQTT